jgi:hypothetical protein
MRHLIATALAALVLQAGFGSATAADNHDNYCRAIKPVCGLNQHPMCLCQSASMFSCGWVCTY